MVKIQCVSRNAEDFTRQTTRQHIRIFRNPVPALHPLENSREVKRAENAAKLDRVFAKPFLYALSGHEDSVPTMTTSPNSLTTLVSGCSDGEIIVWDISRRKKLYCVPKAHTGGITGVIFRGDGRGFLSCGRDKSVKMFLVDQSSRLEKKKRGMGNVSLNEKEEDNEIDRGSDEEDDEEEESDDDSLSDDEDKPMEAMKIAPGFIKSIKPIQQWIGSNPFTSIDFHYSQPQFVTSGPKVELWSLARSAPIHDFTWGAETIQSVKFNPSEQNILASTGSDNTVVIYDSRLASATQKLVMKMRANTLCWNPMEPINFVLASEDSNLYTFDMRKLNTARCVHRDHVFAVMDVAFSPTGLEFVSGSYDSTIRIFGKDAGHSREIYHTKRMGHVLSVKFSADSKYILSGSDDHNVRMWKANASVPIRSMPGGEKRKFDYLEKLKERYENVPQIRRIFKHRQLPKMVYKLKRRERAIRAKARRKEKNVREHSKPGSVPFVPERQRQVVKVLE